MTEEIIADFTDSVNKDTAIKKILNKVKRGKATQRDISDYADLLGKHASSSFNKYITLENYNTAEAKEAIERVMNANYDSINGQGILQLRATDKKSGLDIVIRKVDGKPRTNELIQKITLTKTDAGLSQALNDETIATARRYYDDFQKTNAELRSDLGYKEVVVRTYDDVGLRNGTVPCQWCLNLAGEYDYNEAYELGIWRRHEGCGCHIEILTK